MTNISQLFNQTFSASNITSYSNISNDTLKSPKGYAPVTPDALRDATRVIYVSVFVIGVLGNIMVCYIICKRNTNSIRRSIHTFTLNLAVSDLMVLFIYLPSQLHMFETNMLWKLGDVMCRITYLTVPLCMFSSIGTLVAISRDRYIAVINPMVALEKRNTKYILSTLWVVSFILTIPLILVAKIEKGYCTEIWPNRLLGSVYWIFVFFIQFAIPVLIVAIAHALIIIHLHKVKTPFAGNTRRSIRKRQQQQRLIRMSICLVLCYVICMLPQHIVFFWLLYGDLRNQPYGMYIFQISNLMMILNSALNPIVYGTLNNDIKRGVFSILMRHKRKQQSHWSTRTIELQTISCSGTPLLRRADVISNNLPFGASRRLVAQHAVGGERTAQSNGAEIKQHSASTSCIHGDMNGLLNNNPS